MAHDILSLNEKEEGVLLEVLCEYFGLYDCKLHSNNTLKLELDDIDGYYVVHLSYIFNGVRWKDNPLALLSITLMVVMGVVEFTQGKISSAHWRAIVEGLCRTELSYYYNRTVIVDRMRQYECTKPSSRVVAYREAKKLAYGYSEGQ